MAVDELQWTIKSLADKPDLEQVFKLQKRRIWPAFMLNDVYAAHYWHYLAEYFPEYQIYLLTEAGDPIAVGQTIPLTWDGTMAGLPVGWSDCMVRGVNNYERSIPPNTLAALEISIQPEFHGQGISYRMIRALRDLATRKGHKAVIVAVRPAWKARYPLTPMERYVHWQRQDGAPFDPWLRAHWRSGGEILKTADPSFIAEASVAEWENWTGLSFPESGEYVVPEALTPIQIDRRMNVGRYIESNVWVHHPITTARITPERPPD